MSVRGLIGHYALQLKSAFKVYFLKAINVLFPDSQKYSSYFLLIFLNCIDDNSTVELKKLCVSFYIQIISFN